MPDREDAAGARRGRHQHIGQGRVALGSRAGARVRRLGDARDTPTVTSRGPRQAHLDGFDLPANVWVLAHDRAGLERMCRYILRPPFAQERLRLRSDGRVALELKTAWHDGTRELVFEPLEFLERLAAMTPRPETNLLICHGVLAPCTRWREPVVAYGRVAPEPTAATAPRARGPDGTGVTPTPRAWSWAGLMHRAFAIDVLACVHCGGRLRLIATLHDPAVIRKILAHLGLAHSGQSPDPPQPRPAPPRPNRLGRGTRAADLPPRGLAPPLTLRPGPPRPSGPSGRLMPALRLATMPHSPPGALGTRGGRCVRCACGSSVR